MKTLLPLLCMSMPSSLNDGRIGQAITCLERATKQEVTDKQLYHAIVHTLARLKREMKQYGEAIVYYEMALEDVGY